MMGGTEFNHKKDKAGLEIEITMPEELVGLEVDDMNDE